MSNDEENAKPKRRASWFRWNFDDFIVETDHLSLTEFAAAARLMGAMSRTEDYSLDDDPETLCKIVRGRSGVRVRWERIKTAALEKVLTFKDGRVTCPWLTRKWTQAGLALDKGWTSATDKPLKEKGPNSPNREFRTKNSESKATTAAKARSMAKEKEASRGEQVEKPPRTPEEQAERQAKFAEWNAKKKRDAVAQNLGINEDDIAPYKEIEDDAGGSANDAGGAAA
jgi:hypothetical protein